MPDLLLTFRRSVMCLACGLCAACASAPAPSQERIDTAFRSIQRSEARIEAAAREVDRIAASIAGDAGACVERCAPFDNAVSEASGGAAGVCDAAASIESDNDARVRCDRARVRSAAIEQRARELKQRCGCGEGSAP
jgi:hypothetical protein